MNGPCAKGPVGWAAGPGTPGRASPPGAATSGGGSRRLGAAARPPHPPHPRAAAEPRKRAGFPVPAPPRAPGRLRLRLRLRPALARRPQPREAQGGGRGGRGLEEAPGRGPGRRVSAGGRSREWRGDARLPGRRVGAGHPRGRGGDRRGLGAAAFPGVGRFPLACWPPRAPRPRRRCQPRGLPPLSPARGLQGARGPFLSTRSCAPVLGKPVF